MNEDSRSGAESIIPTCAPGSASMVDVPRVTLLARACTCVNRPAHLIGAAQFPPHARRTVESHSATPFTGLQKLVWLLRADLIREWSTHCTLKFAAVMDTLRPSLGDTLRNLDDQITETRHLCERINAAIRREYDAPYFPERRDHYEPHDPDRRCHQYWSVVEVHQNNKVRTATLRLLFA
jgi:hypothetical protein